MATITICDNCKQTIGMNNGKPISYKITSQANIPERKFIIGPKDTNPNFNLEFCENCAKKLHKYILSIQKKKEIIINE